MPRTMPSVFSGPHYYSQHLYVTPNAEEVLDLNSDPNRKEDIFAPIDPIAKANEARRLAKESGKFEELNHYEFNQLYPEGGTEADKASAEVAQLWRSDVPIYAAKRVHAALRNPEHYANWRWRQGIPEMMTAFQVWYLTNFVMRVKQPNFIDLQNPRHPVEVGDPPNKIKTKVGNTYGTWTFIQCLSEEEAVGNNRAVFYVAKCNVCGYVKPKLDYRRMSAPCPACKRSSKRAEGHEDGVLEHKHPFRLYKMPNDAVQLATEKPEGAIAYCDMTHQGIPLYWTVYEEAPVEEVQRKPRTPTAQEMEEQRMAQLELKRRETMGDPFGD